MYWKSSTEHCSVGMKMIISIMKMKYTNRDLLDYHAIYVYLHNLQHMNKT